MPDADGVSSRLPPNSLALDRERKTATEAEVVDLVRLPAGTSPATIADLEFDEVETRRYMECEHYQTCLNFAAEVRWRSFHCRQCEKNPEYLTPERRRTLGEPAPVIRLS